MKILVTGANGFIGRGLCHTLLSQGHTLYASLRSSSAPKYLSSINTIPFDDTLSPQKSLPNIDVVIHLAARAHILNDPSPNPEIDFFKVNTQGTLNLARVTLAVGAKQFIFISSIGAMSTLSPESLTESALCNPDTPYGRSKLAAEKALTELVKNSSMAYTILRPTLVYGPQNPGNMERLLKLVSEGLSLPLGSIKNQRSLIFVENLIDAILQCIHNPKAYNQTFLLSDGHDISTPDLIKQIAFSLNKKPKLLPIPPKLLKLAGHLTGKSDTIDRLTGSLVVDSSKIRQTLNWTPPYTFQEGIQATCDWYLQTR